MSPTYIMTDLLAGSLCDLDKGHISRSILKLSGEEEVDLL